MAEVKFYDPTAGEGPLDNLAKALNIASTVYGIKLKGDELDTLQKSKEAEIAKLNKEEAAKEAERLRDVKGITTVGKLIEKGYAPAPEGAEKSFTFDVMTEAGTPEKKSFVKVQSENPLLPLQYQNLTGQISARDQEQKQKEAALTVGEYGKAANEKQASEAREALAVRDELSGVLKEIADLRAKYPNGTITDREDITKAKLLSSRFITAYNRDVAFLGALAGEDKKLLVQVLREDPLSVSPLVDVNAQIKGAYKSLDDAANRKLSAAGIKKKVSPSYEEKKSESSSPLDIPVDDIDAELQKRKQSAIKQKGILTGIV